MQPLIGKQRQKYHNSLIKEGVLTIDRDGVASNADKANKLSCQIANGIANALLAQTSEKRKGQTLGDLRPGKWHISRLGNRNSI